MAIIKSLKSRVGIDVSYHRIIGVNINYRDKGIVICVASYVSLESRSNNFEPLEVIDIEVPKDDFDLFKELDPINMAYLWLKENVNGFDASIDDLEIREQVEDEK